MDVPGEALSNVILTRLPFAVPDHPLIEARVESIEARGGNAFVEFNLPEAILKFRQGVGRLIQTRDDSGIVAVLDNRVLTKRYGEHFLNSLPQMEYKRSEPPPPSLILRACTSAHVRDRDFVHHNAAKVTPAILQGVHHRLPQLKLEFAEIHASIRIWWISSSCWPM